MSSLIILSTVLISLTVGEIPIDFHVPLERDRSGTLRVRGYFFQANGLSASPIRPWLRSYDCGDNIRVDEHFLTLHGTNDTRGTVDVSDMVRSYAGSFTCLGLCIGFTASLTRAVESLIYFNDDGHESLVFRPSMPFEFSAAGMIEYTRVQENNHVYAKTVVDVAESSMRLLAFAVNGNVVSTVPLETFAELNRTIAAAGGIRHGRVLTETTPIISEIRLENCYERLVAALPPISYILSNEGRSDATASSRLVFYPEDYIMRSTDQNLCQLLVDAAIPNTPLIITDRLIQRLGGIHFDYANGRIGFFDPL